MMSSRKDAPALLVLSLQATVLSQLRVREAAAAFAGELAAARGCTRVGVGFVYNHFSQLAAVSHGGSGDGSGLEGAAGKAFSHLTAAMDEAVYQGATVVWPDEGAATIRLAHARLMSARGGTAVTVPIVYLGDAVGALCCEWANSTAASPELLQELENVASLAGPLLYLMHLRELPWRRRAANRLRATLQRLRSPEGRRMRITALVAVLAAGSLLALPVPHRIGGHARLEGEQQRALVAPADGFIKAAHVRPGDAVTEGQLLVEMADQELTLQRRKWTSDLNQQENAYASALARADRAALVIALARADEARAHLALVDADLGRTRIVAPFAGIVVEGDLSQALGAPMERGKLLMQLAPLKRYRVVVQVDERDIDAARTGQAGTLALSALPWEALDIKVSRITPLAHAVEGQNVFDVECEVEADASRFRPGLEGVAKIAVGSAPLAWIWFHRFADWARLTAWSWVP